MEKKHNKKSVCKAKYTLLIMVTFLIPAEIKAQTSIFDYLTQALSKIVAGATVINLANYDYVDGNCIFGVYLSKGAAHSLSTQFEGGVNYYVFGAGDNDIIDLDLTLLSSAGEVLLEDSDNDATPILQFKPNYSGNMILKIKNYNSYQAGFCVMVILRESDSGNFSMNQIAQALDNVIKNSRITYLFSSRFARNTFCLFGGRLNNGEDTFIYNTQPPAGRYAMVGAGSNNISDVDLFVIRQQARDYTTGTEIAKDTATDNHPICTFTVNPGYSYLLMHKNYASYGNSAGFVFSILLEL